MESLDVLSLLIKCHKMTFQELVNEHYKNRNKARKNLTYLCKKGLVIEDRKQWKRGQKLYFSATQKGKKAFFVNQTQNLLRSINVLYDALNLPEKSFEDYREAKRNLHSPIIFTGPNGEKASVPLPEDGPQEKEEIQEATKKMRISLFKYHLLLNQWKIANPFNNEKPKKYVIFDHPAGFGFGPKDLGVENLPSSQFPPG